MAAVQQVLRGGSAGLNTGWLTESTRLSNFHPGVGVQGPAFSDSCLIENFKQFYHDLVTSKYYKLGYFNYAGMRVSKSTEDFF